MDTAEDGPKGGYTTTIGSPKEPQRKRINSETWWNYSPVNTTQFGTENILKFQIPTTDVIFDMSRAFISVDFLLPVSVTEIHDVTSTTAGSKDVTPKKDVTAFNDGDHQVNYNKAHFRAVTYSGDTVDTNHEVAGAFPGMLNAANIFSLTEMYMDGNLIWHNDYAQVQSRLWALNKNDQWLDSQPQTFFRPTTTKSIAANDVGDLATIFNDINFYENEKLPVTLNNGTNAMNQQHFVRKQLKIPLVMLYPQFEVMNGWPAFLVKQVLYLQLTVSQLSKYFVSYLSDRPETGPFNVCDISARDTFKNKRGEEVFKDVYNTNKFIPQFIYSGSWVEAKAAGNATIGQYSVLAFDLLKVMIERATLYLPSHVPEFKEREEYIHMVGTGLTYGFKYYNVLSNTTDLVHNQNNNTRSLTYNSAVNNLEAVNLLYLREGTEVIYEKPAIEAIQVNLGNSWHIAANGTHLYNLYRQDSNLLRDLNKGWGQADKPYMQTISEDIIQSYKTSDRYMQIKGTDPADPLWFNYSREGKCTFRNVYDAADPTNDEYVTSFKAFPGAYMLYFDVSPGDELGVSAGQYSKQINLRWTNSGLPELHTDSAGDYPPRCNFDNVKLYVCQQTFNIISITSAGVYIKNPFAEEFNPNSTILKYQNANYDESGLRTHGTFIKSHGTFIKSHGDEYDENNSHGILSTLGSLISRGKEIYRTVSPIIKTGIKIGKGVKAFLHNSKQHGALKFKIRAMEHLGPEGYRGFQHKIDKYANRPYAHKIVIKDLRRTYAKSHGLNHPIMGIGSHVYMRKKFLEGTHNKRYINQTIPKITPGWRGRMNNRPVRLQPFGRFLTSIPTPNGSMDTSHGLCSPYHGIRSWFKKLAHHFYKKKVPDTVKKIIEPHKEQAQELLRIAKEKAKGKYKEIDQRTGGWLGKTVKYGRKLYKGLGADKAAEKALNERFGEHGMRRFKAWASINTSPALFRTMPHGKHMNRFYEKHYGNKFIRRSQKFQKYVSKLASGAKRPPM